jgi:hypothetical protein
MIHIKPTRSLCNLSGMEQRVVVFLIVSIRYLRCNIFRNKAMILQKVGSNKNKAPVSNVKI